jgi:signal transduction histidine kinase/FixJ family two-component response regulator
MPSRYAESSESGSTLTELIYKIVWLGNCKTFQADIWSEAARLCFYFAFIRAMIVNVTNSGRDRILIVESDPIISDLLARQSLRAAGFQTYVVNDAGTAINQVVQFAPDVIIADLWLPGLSGKDLMVALSAQSLDIPVVILAQKGSEADIIPAFRLGAADYLLWPVREAEVVAVVERVLKQVYERRERENLARQLQKANQDLQMRVRELTAIFSLGKAISSITNQPQLYEKILDSAIKVSQADLGWFLLRPDTEKPFNLVAQRNLPAILTAQTHHDWDDSISSLVAMTGEPLAIHGDPLKRFKIIALGQSALIAPLKIQNLVTGLLVLMRQQSNAFHVSELNLLCAIADYASIALVNARLFHEIEERSSSLQRLVDNARSGEKINAEIMFSVQRDLHTSVDTVQLALERLGKDPAARWNEDQRQAMGVLQEQIRVQNRLVEAISLLNIPQKNNKGLSPVKINDLLRQMVNHYRHFAQQNNVTLSLDIPSDSLVVMAEPSQLADVIAGYLSNAIQYTKVAGRVNVRLEKSADQTAHLSVTDTGIGIDSRRIARIFDPIPQSSMSNHRRFGGLGISLPLIKEIITNHRGRVWAESRPGQGATFHFSLPLIGK